MRKNSFLIEETQVEYFNRLAKTLKIKELGEGAYAKVFQHPVYSNVAVKFFQDDPMYVKYIRHCLKAQENPWIPKIVSVHKIKVDSHRYHFDLKGQTRDKFDQAYLVFFQKLREATTKEIKNAARQIVADLPDSYFYPEFGDIGDNNPWFDYRRSDIRSFENWSIRTWLRIAKFSKDEHIKQLAKILVAVEAKDIHDANVMMRDEGDRTQLVFTDPVAS